jgi:Tol biopolymer transport system component
MRTLPGQETRICVVPFDGGTPKAVTAAQFGLGGDWDPTWSPDGKEIAFGDAPGVRAVPLSKRMIHVVTLDTGRVRSLTGSEGMWSARWSPNGRYIAALSALPWRVVLYDLQKRQQIQISELHGSYPNWSPDGKFVYFVTEGEENAWWRVRIADRRLEKVKTTKDFLNGASNWFTVTANNSLVAARDVSSDQIYALHWEAR